MKLVNTLSILGISIGMMFLLGMSLTNQPQTAQATGGAGQIKDLIDPMIERAIEYIKQGNMELALEEIESLQKELSDTYEADKED